MSTLRMYVSIHTENVQCVAMSQLSVTVRDNAGVVSTVDWHQVAQFEAAASLYSIITSHNVTQHLIDLQPSSTIHNGLVFSRHVEL